MRRGRVEVGRPLELPEGGQADGVQRGDVAGHGPHALDVGGDAPEVALCLDQASGLVRKVITDDQVLDAVDLLGPEHGERPSEQ